MKTNPLYYKCCLFNLATKNTLIAWISFQPPSDLWLQDFTVICITTDNKSEHHFWIEKKTNNTVTFLFHFTAESNVSKIRSNTLWFLFLHIFIQYNKICLLFIILITVNNTKPKNTTLSLSLSKKIIILGAWVKSIGGGHITEVTLAWPKPCCH